MTGSEVPLPVSSDRARVSVPMLLNRLLDSTRDHIYFKDLEGRFILVSESLAQSFGCTRREVEGKTDFDFFREPQARAYREVELRITATREPVVDREVKHVWQDGRVTWAWNTASVLLDDEGTVIGVWGMNKDITAQKLLEQAVAAQTHRADEMTNRAVEEAKRNEYLAYHDQLTGLPNRSLFAALLTETLNETRSHRAQFAVAFLDLDRFKHINDSLGHEAGDQLLQEAARRLQACIRKGDSVARLGGDEFVVLLPNVAETTDAAAVAEKILASLAAPFTLIGHEFRVTASIGISIYPKDGLDEDSLTKHADIAMYQAKDEGKNTHRFYSPSAHTNSLERLTLESSLRHALERGEFRLHYQAKREVRSGAITGMEALLRWEHPDFGTVAPLRFIRVAEETGLIVPIGKWVLRTACSQNVAWQRRGFPPLSIAVNLTARQFCDDHLLQDVRSILSASGMDAHLLELEIPESLLIQNVEKTLVILGELKALGIRIVIDDFGTGYSTLANLQRFPLDSVKIDRSFIRQITDTSKDSGLTDALIAMGKNLSLTVIAQGVETKEQAEYLRVHTCDELQGFYFRRPLPADQFEELLHAQSAGITYTGKQLRLPET